MGERSARKLARNFSRQPNGRRAGERRKESQSNARIAKKVTGDPGNERNQRRMINISPLQMLAAGEVIHLVPKNSVTVRGEKMENEFQAG